VRGRRTENITFGRCSFKVSHKYKAIIDINKKETIALNKKAGIMTALMETKRKKRGSQGIEPIVSSLTKAIHVLFDTKNIFRVNIFI
jgi:hypothetical protein